MKISQIVKEKRKHLGLTQENIAEYLGVSTPAVSKWENGTTYPDITLLPGLARLLKTDLNTSFHDLGADYYNQFNTERKVTAYLKKLKALGWQPDAMAAQPA